MKPNAASERSEVSERDDGPRACLGDLPARKQMYERAVPDKTFSLTINLHARLLRLSAPLSGCIRLSIRLLHSGCPLAVWLVTHFIIRSADKARAMFATPSLFAFSRHLFLTIGSRGTNGGIESATARNRGKAWTNHHAVTWEGI
jgi:hypothetical protein